MNTYSASRYISVNNFNRMSEKDREELQKSLVEKCKAQIAESKDPVDRSVHREVVVQLMLKVEARMRPAVKAKSVDLKKLNIGSK
jgi:hypothetical protein